MVYLRMKRRGWKKNEMEIVGGEPHWWILDLFDDKFMVLNFDFWDLNEIKVHFLPANRHFRHHLLTWQPWKSSLTFFFFDFFSNDCFCTLSLNTIQQGW